MYRSADAGRGRADAGGAAERDARRGGAERRAQPDQHRYARADRNGDDPATETATAAPSDTQPPTDTDIPPATATATLTASATASATPTPTVTWTYTPSLTITNTITPLPSPTFYAVAGIERAGAAGAAVRAGDHPPA
ncbi:MAG: hypothetical protein U0703_20220 [Anaerolineae bacterium]